jgi:hypothetical protein
MKNPMTKTTARPIFLLSDICKREITGMGNVKMRRSVKRLKAAHVHLKIVSGVTGGRDGTEHLPKPRKADTVALDSILLPRFFNRCTLKDGQNDESKAGCDDNVNQCQEYSSKQCCGKDAEV